jgi:hypothetical protein
MLDDYDVPSTINVSEFQFPLALTIDHSPSPNSDAATANFDTFSKSHSLIMILLMMISVQNLDFLEINGFELKNVNKEGWRASKHTELWAKKLFDDWRRFWGDDIQNFIIDLSKREETIKDLVDMLCLFVLQVAKKDDILYPLTMFDYEILFFQILFLFFPSNSFNCFPFLFPPILLLFLTFCLPIPLQPNTIFEHFILLLLLLFEFVFQFWFLFLFISKSDVGFYFTLISIHSFWIFLVFS